MEKLQQLGSASMGQACSTWLSSVIGDLQRQLPGLLAGCKTAAQLTQLEAAVHEGIAAWHKPVMTIAAPGPALPASVTLRFKSTSKVQAERTESCGEPACLVQQSSGTVSCQGWLQHQQSSCIHSAGFSGLMKSWWGINGRSLPFQARCCICTGSTLPAAVNRKGGCILASIMWLMQL